MMVRCGACRTQFDVPGPGRFSCPSCGSVNVVRSAANGGVPPTAPAGGAPPPGMPGAPGGMPQAPQAPPSPPPPEPPSPKLECPECGFSFIVGEIDVATCPNCGAEVETGWTSEASE